MEKEFGIQETPFYEERASWLDRSLLDVLHLNWEVVIFATIMIFAVFSRFYILGVRTMSHDETSHVYFSWLLYEGRGYQHDPITHGPFQFHVVALSYFLFGDNDFTARVPAALFSVATVAFIWYFRRYIGRAGALIAATMFAISPYMMFYGRYVRNEAFVAFAGVVMLWAILEYYETGAKRYLYFLSAALALQFTAKETAYIYTAQALLFFAIFFLYTITQKPWPNSKSRSPFLYSLIFAVLLFTGALGYHFLNASSTISSTETAVPSVPGQSLPAATGGVSPVFAGLFLLGVIALLAAAYFLIQGYTLRLLRADRSFDLLMLCGVIVLPLLAAFPLKFVGWDVPINAAEVNAMTFTDIWHMGLVLGIMILLAVLFGLWWNTRLFLGNFGLFYGIFILFYTTFFTNGAGLFTGLLGSLGYWLAQQAVDRGSQPWYYYALIQIPMYEYLEALGSILALILVAMGIRARVHPAIPVEEASEPPQIALEHPEAPSEFEAPANPVEDPPLEEEPTELDFEPVDDVPPVTARQEPPTLALFGFWAITSLVAYSYAGEKMPWLTVHIALAMIFLAGWSLGYLVEKVDWQKLKAWRSWLVIGLLVVFLVGIAGSLSSLLGATPPFQGKTLDQLQATSTFLTAFIAALASGIGLAYLLRDWAFKQTVRVFTLTFFALLGVLTLRTTWRANFINYNYATELLVYAHTGPGIKEALNQIVQLSERTTNGLDMQVAYDSDTTYPYWWYLRYFPNQVYYGSNPTRDLRNAPAILVGETNYGKIEPIVGQGYYMFQYTRMWWPNQSYFDLTWNRIAYAITNPQMRSAIFQIWFNDNYKPFGDLTNQDLSLANWQPSQSFRLYLRKDLVAQLWNYGAAPAAPSTAVDPYEGKQIQLNADKILGGSGSTEVQFNSPRAVAVAPDGTLYVADSGNNRIVHLTTDGKVLQTWGSAGAIQGTTAPPPSTFNEPWGIAVGPDGSVYVSDTWNHRIQKFTADGKFEKMWGTFGQGETPLALWGPRGIAVDSQGHVFVADTGNKRIVEFDSNGSPITTFGSEGAGPGQFDEPTDIALDAQGNVYVTDTWNQRVQVMAPGPNNTYTPKTSWDIAGWYGQSLENKPSITLDKQGNVYVTDPEGYRVLEFNQQGQFIRFWGDLSTGPNGFGLPNGIASDGKGGLWVADAGNNRVMHFTVPGG